MEDTDIAAFIRDYIASRKRAKLEAFDKEAAKRLAAGNKQATELEQERYELEQRFIPQHWLSDAAARAGQINLVTHAAKFTHGDSKSSSLYSEIAQSEGYVNSFASGSLEIDAVGNAAALDVAKLLQTKVAGDSLLACLKRKDYRALDVFAENEHQLAQWIAGFSQALTPGNPSSHKLAKQIYFPVDEGYHLLSPLFATSLAQVLFQKIAGQRFGEEAKAIWQARQSGSWHAKPLIRFHHTAEMHFGGTKPQNISALNSARGGRSWLLSAQPPHWRQSAKPPVELDSFFRVGGEFDLSVKTPLEMLTSLLQNSGDYNNSHIRQARDRYIEEIIDTLFFCASKYQREEWQSWTIKCPQLKAHQQLWLDPWRTKIDDVFRIQREQNEWQELIAEDFASWLNYRLSKQISDVGQTEYREWKTHPHFSLLLRETEQLIKDELR